MAIIQISKIQHRSGDLVDLPQLDEAELGFASDARRLFIGKTSPNENVEVLTSYSTISFSQIQGSYGNLNITIDQDTALESEGQILTFDGEDWTNRGGDKGGLITLGDVSNVKLTGGAISYVLETDGTGNLSWGPKGAIVADIENIENANGVATITTQRENFFPEGSRVTLTGTDAAGVPEVNGFTYFLDIISNVSFGLYTDPSLTTPELISNTYAYSNVTATTTTINEITLGNVTPFTGTENSPIRFEGDLGNSLLVDGDTYFVKDVIVANNAITVSDELINNVASNVYVLQTDNALDGIGYISTGRVLGAPGATGASLEGGANTQIQFNRDNIVTGESDLTYDYDGALPNKILNINGNIQANHLNASNLVVSSRYISNVLPAAGANPPLTVLSTDRVANLNVEFARSADQTYVEEVANGVFYPTFVANLTNLYPNDPGEQHSTNANFYFDATDGNLVVDLLTGVITTNNQPNINQVGTLDFLNVANLTTTDDLTVNNVTQTNTLEVASDTDIGGNVTINGTIDGNSSLTIDGDTQLNANLVVEGTVLGNSSATIEGNLDVSSNVNVEESIFANSNITANSDLLIQGDSTLEGNVVINGQLDVPGVTDIGTIFVDEISIEDLFLSNGPATFTNTVNITGNSFTVTTGDVTFGGVLSVSGEATFESNVNVSNADINVTGDVLSSNTVIASTLESNVANGVAPLRVASSTLVANLNADLLDGFHANTSVEANTVVVRDLNGNIYANNIGGTLIDSNQPNVTQLGDLLNLTVNGPVNINNNDLTVANGNVFGDNFFGNFIGNVSGNITIPGSPTQVPFIDANGYATSDANLTFDSVSRTLSVDGNISYTANLTGGNASVNLLNANQLDMGDNDFINLGDNADLSIYHSGTESVIWDNGPGPLRIRTTSLRVTNAAGDEELLRATVNSGPILFHAGDEKLRTTTTGINVTGNLDATVDGNFNGNVTANIVNGTTAIISPQLLAPVSGNARPGSITGQWTLTPGSTLRATYADLAEYYEGDADYDCGTVLMFGGEKEVTLAESETRKVAGVVTTNPAYVMNVKCPGIAVAIALQGRTPVKVRGPVSKGDMLVADNDGYAKVADDPKMGTVIGKSLVDFSGSEGVIEIAVGRL